MTEDAEAAHADLQAWGVDAGAEVMRYPVPMFSFRDPNGNRLVIVESVQAANQPWPGTGAFSSALPPRGDPLLRVRQSHTTP